MELIPINSSVHYKTAFDIHTSNEDEISNLRRTIRSWCLRATKNFNNQDLHSAWFFRGDGEQHRIGNYLFRVYVNVGNYTLENPENWIVEIIHPDREHRNRKWSIEITFSQVDRSLIRFAATVKNWMNEGYIGEIPDHPDLTTPGFVRDILNSRSITCRKGDGIVNSTPKTIRLGEAKDLFDKIISGSRYLPLVLISKHRYNSGYCIDAQNLQKKILGNANVYLLSSEKVNNEINYYLGNDFSCSFGSLRVYMPKVKLDYDKDSFRHRFYSTRYIEDLTEEQVTNDITIGLSRNARTFTTKEILTTYDVVAARRRHKIRELFASKDENEEQSEELKLLWEEVEDLSKKKKESDSLVDLYQTENEQFQQENSNLKWQISQTDQVREENTLLQRKVRVFNEMDKLPESLTEVVDITISSFPTKLSFTDRGVKSAQDYKNGNEIVGEAWEMLRKMASTLHRLIFDEKSGDLEGQFKTETGYDLAMTEGRQTKRDSSLMRLRKDTYEGNEIDITPHVKFGNKEPKLLRIHFYPDEENKLIVVGHCGEHLDNFTTKSMS
ncbi:hypothetical protein [Endozoicomonas sp. ALC066]|uniref:hypothetical protein n=1 Tax=Endozoicomonas sp. ALC066 TaxID=3403078 RepID=UPI003BB7B659